MRTIVICLFLSSLIMGCTTKQNHQFKSKEEYSGYLNYKYTEWCEKCNCKDTLLKVQTFEFDIDFEFKHSDFEFLILREGVIYKGAFNKKITLNDVCYCLDENLTKLNTLAFVLLDKKEEVVYKWYEKQSYYLYKEDKISVKLKNDGSYKLRFR